MDCGLSIREVYRAVAEFADGGRSFAVATVLRAEGSTPQKAGAKAAIEANGKIWGTIGGGSVEAEAQRRAIETCRTRQPVAFDFFLEGGRAADVEPICGGMMRVLIDPTAAKDRAAYGQAAEAFRLRKRGVVITTIGAHSGVSGFGVPPSGGKEPTEVGTTNVEVKVQWLAEEELCAEIGFPDANAVRACLVRETPQAFVGDPQPSGARIEVLVEPIVPWPLLLIAGGGHVGQALARQAVLIGFDVVVVDDRPEFTDPALFPEGVTTRCGDIAKEIAGSPIAADTYVVIVTRGHQHDAEALAACIHKPAAYLGMIGSKRKVALMRRHFIETGLATEEELNRVFAPIGLGIGAVTVPEIATSIAAQLIAVRRKRESEA